MLNEKELCIQHFIYQITNPLHKILSRLLLKLIIPTNDKDMEKVKDFINYTSKTLNKQNAFYRFKNICTTFIMPLNEAPLYISDKSLLKDVICKWRLKIGR